MYPFTFKVVFNSYVDNKLSSECGFGFADSYAEAANIIEKRYGEDLMSIEHLMLCEEDSLIIVEEDACVKFENAFSSELDKPCKYKKKSLGVKYEEED